MSKREQQRGFDLRGSGDDRFQRRGRIAFGLLAIGLLAGGVGYWATATTISGAVIASGSVKVMNEVKQIQHRDGGIVAEIMVERGQAVRKGDVLVLPVEVFVETAHMSPATYLVKPFTDQLNRAFREE